jgi:hypothetical protein
MASYLDTIPKYSPYISQVPVELMAKVGMAKQQQYEQGIQKIQSTIDNVAGLDVYKDEDKQYLQSKLNELGDNLKWVGASDFSDFQLVNSVNGMTRQIAKDENVLTAVSSTAVARKELAYMEEERKKGKLNPSNEYVFKKQFSDWANDGKVGSSFNAKYDPSFDIWKFAKETFDAVKPDEFSFDQIYQLGADGKPMTDSRGNLILSPTMTRIEKEGIFPAKVKATLDQIFSDPRVAKQLSIDGMYNYRGLDENALSQKIINQKVEILGQYENQLAQLTLQKSMGKDVQQEIDSLYSKMETTANSYDQYANVAIENPDAIRGALYKDDVSARYTTMFGQVKERTQVMENPGWNQNWKMQVEANEQSRWAQTFRYTKERDAVEDIKWQKKYEQDERLAGLKAKGKSLGGGDNDGDGMGPGAGPGGEASEQAAQNAAIETIRVQATDFDKAASNYSVKSDAFIWETIFSKMPNNNIKLKDLMSKGMKRDDAISLLINNGAKKSKQTPEEYKAYWSGKAVEAFKKLSPEEQSVKPVVEKVYKDYKESKRIFDAQLIVKQRIDAQTKLELGKIGEKLAMMDIKPQEIIYKDKKYTLTKEDMLDLAIYKKGNLGFMQSTFGYDSDVATALKTESKMALSRLMKRGKGDLAEAYINDNKNVTVDANGKATKVQNNSIWEGIKGLGEIPTRLMYESEGWGGVTRNWSQIHAIEGMINSDQYTSGIKRKAEIIQQHYNITPNRNIDIITGDGETDKNTLAKLRRWGSEYTTTNANLSPDFKEFVGSLKTDPNDNVLGARTIFDENNEPMVEVISYDPENGERVGGITIQPDQARKIGIDLGTLYEADEISALRNKINYNDYKTSEGDPADVKTYIEGDSYYDKYDFPGMKGNTTLDVQANIIYSSGEYFPYLYIKDGNKKPVVRELPGDANLENVVSSLKLINPTIVKSLSITPN